MATRQGDTEVQRVYESYKWLLYEDISNKEWKRAQDRVEAMRKEMRLFGGAERANEFIDEYVGDLAREA